jgi:hypothetical protein
LKMRVARGVAAPVFGEPGDGRIDAFVLEELEPDELEVEVVVGGGFVGHRVEIVECVGVAAALVGCAERSADVLAEPAGVDLVAKFGAAEDDAIHGKTPG